MTKQAPQQQTLPGKQLLALPIALFVASLCIMLAVTAALTNLVFLDRANDQQLRLIAGKQAQDYSNSVSSYIEGHQSDLARLIKQPRIAHALRTNDLLTLAVLENEFQDAFADAVSLKLVPITTLGTADPLFSSRQFSNIEIDMIQRAMASKNVYAEGYKDSGYKIGLIEPLVNDDKEVEGVVLLSLKLGGLYRLLLSVAAEQGELKLTQQHGEGKKRSLAHLGSAANNVPTTTSNVKLAHNWQLDFTPSDQLAKATAFNGEITWSVFSIAGALTIMLGWITYRVTSSRLNDDASKLNATLTLWSNGKDVAPPTLRLDAFNTVINNSKQLLAYAKKNSSQSHSPSKTASSAQRPPEIDEPEELDGLPDDFKMDLFDYQEPALTPIAPHIFRAYDIRGLVNSELTKNAAYQIGLALGSEASELECSDIIVARDGRMSSPELSDNLIRGIVDSGCDTINLGAVPTPLLYFATHKLHAPNGAVVTGSHLTSEYNGIKMVLENSALADQDIQHLKQRITLESFTRGSGDHTELDIIEHYIADVVDDISLPDGIKVVLDCGNAIPAIVAPELFTALGCEVIPLFCDLDSSFPNHAPDPSKSENLKELIANVKLYDADIGIAFDGDGDRFAAVTAKGKIVPADHLLALFAKDVLASNKGATVAYDVKCGRYLQDSIDNAGGVSTMSPSGHSRIKAAMKESGALLGGEYSGHFFFADRWPGFDDGLYAAARLLELIGKSSRTLDELIARIPTVESCEEILIPVAEGDQFAIVDAIKDNVAEHGKSATSIDGVRVDYEDGWGLIRGSNTGAYLTLRFEADNIGALTKIQGHFSDALKEARPDLAFKF